MIIPRSRPEAQGWRWSLWALFGNDDGGVYGERDDRWISFPENREPTLWVAIRWWLRNPFHNLFWHVLARPRESVYVLIDSDGYHYRRPPKQWLREGSHYQFTFDPFYVSWRTESWEGYAGWRDINGALGFALRRISR